MDSCRIRVNPLACFRQSCADIARAEWSSGGDFPLVSMALERVHKP